MLFLITDINGFSAKGKYLGDNEIKFEFSTQTSAPKINHSIVKGSIIDIDTEPIKHELFLGCVYDIEGSFMNYTKKNPPEITLVSTKATSF